VAGPADRGLRSGGWVGSVELPAADRVREDLPRLVDASHLIGRVGHRRGVGMQVRVVALGQPPMRAGDLERRRVAADPEDGVRIEGAATVHSEADSTAAGRRPSV
jgi:hypothetical protein